MILECEMQIGYRTVSVRRMMVNTANWSADRSTE